MALENGDNILDYQELEKCLEKYKLDNKIFEKAFILLNLYMNQSSWPHSYEEYINEGSRILGDSPYWIARNANQLLDYFDNEENSKVDSNFKRDLEFFSQNTFWILDNSYYERSTPFTLSSISSSEDLDGNLSIKISRMDNTSLSLSLTKSQLEYFIESLQKILTDGANKND